MMDRGRVAASLLGLLVFCAGCSDDDEGPPPTAVPTPTATRPTSATPATATPAPSGTATLGPAGATATHTRTTNATATVTATAVATASVTPSATPDPPEITFFGIARADDLALVPTELDAAGRPVFERFLGQAMTIVLEARRGAQPLELSAYDPGGGRRGVEFLVSRPLGDGSPAVCDFAAPMIGGVPGIEPPLFSDQAEVQDAIDDLGCRVNDGTGAPLARFGQSACTLMEPSFEYGFVAPGSEVQYCLPIARLWNFAVGETIVAARVRDSAGAVSAVREIVVRVQREQPFVCDQGLGERTFTVRRPPSRLMSSATGEDASVDPWLTASLRICAGRPVGDGLYPLNLRDDAVLGVALADGGVLCARISARGSSGSIDCDGGTALDVRASRDREALTRIAIESGLGLDAGTGAAVIRAPVAFVQLPDGATPDDCPEATYPEPFNAALTTATGTAQVLDLDGTVLAEASASGVSFSCETWRDGGAGAFALPLPIVNGPSGDLATVLVLGE